MYYYELLLLDDEQWIKFSNMTVLNLVFKFLGPMRESRLTWILIMIQVFFSCVAFYIHFRLAGVFYDFVE